MGINCISNNHILLRGRKNVLYHDRKRTVELQALVSRRDITLDDSVVSDKIIEEARELTDAAADGNSAHIEEEFGDLTGWECFYNKLHLDDYLPGNYTPKDCFLAGIQMMK